MWGGLMAQKLANLDSWGRCVFKQKWEWIQKHPLVVSFFFLKTGLFLPEKFKKVPEVRFLSFIYSCYLDFYLKCSGSELGRRRICNKNVQSESYKETNNKGISICIYIYN